MSFEDKEIDDEKLLEEIDKLEDNYNSNVISNSDDDNDVIGNKDNTKKNIIIVVLLVFVLSAYVLYNNFIKKMITNDDVYVPPVIEENYHSADEFEYNDYTDDDYLLDNYTLDDYGEREELRKEKFEQLKSNIKVEYVDTDIDSYGEILLKVENNNDEPVCDFEVYAIFYDESNKPIYVRQEMVYYIGAGKTYYLNLYLDNSIEFSRIETLVNKEYFYDETPNNIENNVVYKETENGDLIIVKGKNNGEKEIDDLLFQIVFYDNNGNIIKVDSTEEYNLIRNEGFKLIFNKPYDYETYENIDYSTYKIELVYAIEKVLY